MTDYKKQISTEDREELEKKTGFTKQTSGSKAIKILARRLRAQRIKHSVYKIRDLSTNKLTVDSETIQTIFKSYYEMLSTYSFLCDNNPKLFVEIRPSNSRHKPEPSFNVSNK